MMRYTFFLILFTTILSAQEFNKLDEQGKKHGLWKGVFEESKRPRYEGTFSHGKEVGLFKFFDDTKAGSTIATRQFNEKDNACYTIFYNQKGNKVSEGNVVDRVFEGEWKYYHENLPQIMTTEFYKNGKLDGSRKVFYRNGKLAEEITYENGIKNGAYKSFTEQGVLLESSTYKNDQYDGEAIYSDASGKIVSQGKYKNGKKVGVWKFWKGDKMTKQNMNFQGKKFQKRTEPVAEDPLKP